MIYGEMRWLLEPTNKEGGSGKEWTGSIEVELCCILRISCDTQDKIEIPPSL